MEEDEDRGYKAERDHAYEDKVLKAEIKFACFIVEHNISFNTANHLLFSHYVIAHDVKLKRIKCTDIVKCVGTVISEDLAAKLCRYKFLVSIDESTDVSSTKSSTVITV